MRHQPSIVFAFVSVLLLLIIEPYEACRSVPRDDERVWMRKEHLLLPSLQGKPVPPPGQNPGTNNAVESATLGEKNFAGATPERGSLKKHLLLPSLQWKQVPPPTPNAGTNNVVNSANLGEKNFVAASLKKHLLLPSLWRPVSPPKSNPGTNSALAGAKNFSGGKMVVRPPSSSKHHSQQLPAVSHKAAS